MAEAHHVARNAHHAPCEREQLAVNRARQGIEGDRGLNGEVRSTPFRSSWRLVAATVFMELLRSTDLCHWPRRLNAKVVGQTGEAAATRLKATAVSCPVSEQSGCVHSPAGSGGVHSPAP